MRNLYLPDAVFACDRTHYLRSTGAECFSEWRAWGVTAALLDAWDYQEEGYEVGDRDERAVECAIEMLSMGFPAAAAETIYGVSL